MNAVVHVTLKQLQDAAERCARTYIGYVGIPKAMAQVKVYGIPRGGIAAAALFMAALRNENVYATMTDDPAQADVFVDDLVDSGATEDRYCHKYPGVPFYRLTKKMPLDWFTGGSTIVDPPLSAVIPGDGALAFPLGTWLVFPWEKEESGNDRSAHDIVVRLLQLIGEDPTREGLQDTPARFINAWKEWGSGYTADVPALFKTFEDGSAGYDQLVVVHNIPVVSYCEHHLAPIHGIAHVGYIPGTKIVGLSKMARVVDAFARRLQVQERMTVEIAHAMQENLQPRGVGVLIRAAHMCMSSRGVKIHNSTTTTSTVLGVLRDSEAARSEFLHLCRDAE